MQSLILILAPNAISNLVAVLGIAAFLLLAVIWYRRDRRLDSIPGPSGGYPLIGIGFQLPLNAAKLLHDWALQYGDIYKIRVGYYNWIVINSPEAVREILEKQAISTSSKAPAPMSHDIVTSGKRMPTMPYGSHWRAQRSLVRHITTVPMTASFVPSQEFEAKQLLMDLATDNQNQRNFYQHMRRYAFSIIMTNTFGERVQTWDHPDAQNAMRSQEILRDTSRPGAFIVDELPPLQRLPKWLQPGWRRAEHAAQQVSSMKMALWRRMEKQVEEGTAAHCYAREIVEKKKSWYAQGLDDEDLAWVAGGLVEAGFETTAIALNSLMLYLASNPRVQEIAQEELLSVIGPDRLPTFADLGNLLYIRACVKEVLRINPMLFPGIKHFADADVTYKGHIIPKGTVLLANTTFLHFDPNRYYKPSDFMPERFLQHRLYSSEYAAMGDPYARDHFTFSTGRRTCPGARLAENSIGIALAAILWAFEIRPPLVDGVEVGIKSGDEAFFPGPFHIPKPFAARFMARSEARRKIIAEQWDIATREGYNLRGAQVNIDGIVRD